MKSPSRNISSSLRGQSSPGRGAESIAVSGIKKGQSMTVPGDGSVEVPPGKRHERSAAEYAEPAGKVR